MTHTNTPVGLTLFDAYQGEAEDGDGGDDQGEPMDEDPVDPYDLADPVDITAKLPGNFYELIVCIIGNLGDAFIHKPTHFACFFYKGIQKMARTTRSA